MTAEALDRVATAPRRTALYRMFDVDGALLYIGIAYSFGRRWAQEAAEKSWWPEVQRQTVEWYSSREEAHRAEVEAIQAEKPKYNIAHTPQRPRRPKRVTETWPDSRRFAGFIADTAEDGCYMPAAPDLVAPGTYLVTLGYHGTEDRPVTVTQCVLISPGDSAAQEYGGREPCNCAQQADLPEDVSMSPCQQHSPEFYGMRPRQAAAELLGM